MDFRPLFVSYCQLLVGAASEPDELGLYLVGDDLLQVCGASTLHGMTGVHTGEVQLQAEARGAAPDPQEWQEQGWQGVSEATVWCDGLLTPPIMVHGLMGEGLDPMPELATGRGLHRVQLRARNRVPEWQERPEPDHPEQYEVLVWPVQEDLGHRTVADDAMHTPGWTPDPGRAAGWALDRLVQDAQPDPLRDNLFGIDHAIDDQHPRVETTRSVLLPREQALAALSTPGTWLFDPSGDLPAGDGVLPADRMELVLEPNAHIPDLGRSFAVTWRSTGTAVVPDDAVTDLRLQLSEEGDRLRLTLRHLSVRPQDAVLLGLVWEAVLTRLTDGAAGWPWAAELDRRQTERAAAETAETEQQQEWARRARAREVEHYGSEAMAARSDRLTGNARAVVGLDQNLIARLAEATPEQQRAVAIRACRAALERAGLAGLDWVDRAVRAAEAGEPPAAPFDDPATAFDRLYEPGVPQTVVAPIDPDRYPAELHPVRVSATHMAIPAVLALTTADPLTAAAEVLWSAAHTAGPDYPALFAEVRAAFPEAFGAG